MIHWYLSVKNAMRSIEQKARDALPLYEQGGKEATAALNGYICTKITSTYGTSGASASRMNILATWVDTSTLVWIATTTTSSITIFQNWTES